MKGLSAQQNYYPEWVHHVRSIKLVIKLIRIKIFEQNKFVETDVERIFFKIRETNFNIVRILCNIIVTMQLIQSAPNIYN